MFVTTTHTHTLISAGAASSTTEAFFRWNAVKDSKFVNQKKPKTNKEFLLHDAWGRRSCFFSPRIQLQHIHITLGRDDEVQELLSWLKLGSSSKNLHTSHSAAPRSYFSSFLISGHTSVSLSFFFFPTFPTSTWTHKWQNSRRFHLCCLATTTQVWQEATRCLSSVYSLFLFLSESRKTLVWNHQRHLMIRRKRLRFERRHKSCTVK